MTPIYPNQQIKALSNDENPYAASKQQSRKAAQERAVTYGLNLAHNREKKLSYSQKKVTTFTYRNKVKQGINHALTSNSTNNGATKRKTGAIQPLSMYPGVNKSFYKTSTLGLKKICSLFKFLNTRVQLPATNMIFALGILRLALQLPKTNPKLQPQLIMMVPLQSFALMSLC